MERVKLTDIGVERVKLTEGIICPFQHILEAFFAVTKVAIETTILYSNMAAVFSFCSV